MLGVRMDRVRDLDTQARNVLERFGSQIIWVVDSVANSFDLEPHFRDDLKQDAKIRVLTYADLMEGWGHGRLFRWVKKTQGEENQVKALLARQLRIDLSQIVSRQVGKTDGLTMPDSLDEMIEEGDEPVDELFETRVLDLVVGSETDMHDRYPWLSLNVLDGYTQDQIAEANGVSRRTVIRKIGREKYAFLISYVKRQGLRIEGDETMAELEEAYGYLKAAGR
jgi:CRP-like cAMP-binding protein